MYNPLSPRQKALKDALDFARTTHPYLDKSLLEGALLSTQLDAEIPIPHSVIDKIRQRSQKLEHKRKYASLAKALESARDSDPFFNRRGTPYSLDYWISKAQEFSEIPLTQSVVDKIEKEYQNHEPLRRVISLKLASQCVGSPKYRNSEEIMNLRLNWAKEHSHGMIDKLRTYVSSWIIRRNFKKDSSEILYLGRPSKSL